MTYSVLARDVRINRSRTLAAKKKPGYVARRPCRREPRGDSYSCNRRAFAQLRLWSEPSACPNSLVASVIDGSGLMSRTRLLVMVFGLIVVLMGAGLIASYMGDFGTRESDPTGYGVDATE